MLILFRFLSAFVDINFLMLFLSWRSNAKWSDLNLSIEAEVCCVPITTAFEHHDVVSLDNSHDVIITLDPVITASVNPADVMTSISRAPLVRHNTNQLIATSVKT